MSSVDFNFLTANSNVFQNKKAPWSVLLFDFSSVHLESFTVHFTFFTKQRSQLRDIERMCNIGEYKVLQLLSIHARKSLLILPQDTCSNR